MKKFRVIVDQSDVCVFARDIEAESLEQAEEMVDKEIENPNFKYEGYKLLDSSCGAELEIASGMTTEIKEEDEQC